MSENSSVRTLLLVGLLLVFGLPLAFWVLSAFLFGTGSSTTFGGMMGGGMMFFGAPMFGGWLLFVALVLGLGYVLLGNESKSGGDESRTTEREGETEDEALATLRERYARGELDDEEFERKVEALLETESAAEAENRPGRR